jgi:hypothetical protein
MRSIDTNAIVRRARTVAALVAALATGFGCSSSSDSGGQSDGASEAGTCGDNAGCPTGQYCEYANGDCGVSGEGTCKVPTSPPCRDNYVPVCGCNDVTYDNLCSAAGNNLAHDGECVGETQSN